MSHINVFIDKYIFKKYIYLNLMDYKKLKESCDKMYNEYNEMRYHYDKLKKDHNELMYHYNSLKKDHNELKDEYEILSERYDVLHSKYNTTIEEIKRRNQEQIKELNKDLKVCNRLATVVFSPETKRTSQHIVLDKPKKKR